MTRRPVDRPDLRRLLAQVHASGADESALHEQLADCIYELAVHARARIVDAPECLVWSGPVNHREMAAAWRLAVSVTLVDIGDRQHAAARRYDGDGVHAARVAAERVESLGAYAAQLWTRLEVMLPHERGAA